ncbi:MAG: hypothetical protein KGO05_08285, partial [Chloroflexota bacterium]|nr:hypothetical protein [Chloroflexota bacterium]
RTVTAGAGVGLAMRVARLLVAAEDAPPGAAHAPSSSAIAASKRLITAAPTLRLPTDCRGGEAIR